jgi:mRNA interferase MazF
MNPPTRGDVWQVDFGATRGHEPSGIRPALVLSVDGFNAGPADLVIVLPITSKRKGVLYHVEVLPPEGGLPMTSYVKCEDVRSIAKDRLLRYRGSVLAATLTSVEDRLRILLGL